MAVEGKIATRLERITPRKAAAYLAFNTRNRPVRKAWVEKLAQMMRDGDFHVTHQGIAFDEKGNLADGQHRLLAVVESGCHINMNVSRGIDSVAMHVVDTGKGRSVADAMAIDGLEVNGRDVAIGKRIAEGIEMSGAAIQTRTDLMRFVGDHLEAIGFARSGLAEREVRHASICAVVARAWYTKDRVRLGEFMECLKTGVMKSDADKAAILLRNFVIRTNNSGKLASEMLYRKTEWALRHFLEKKAPDALIVATNELFPLPEEAKDAANGKRR